MPATGSNLPRPVIWIVPILIVVIATALIVVSLGGDDDTAADGDIGSEIVGGNAGTGAPGAENTDDVGDDPEAAGDTDSDGEEFPDTARRIEGDPLALGAVDAPVALVVYSDYQCPYCALWVNDTLPTIMSDYVEPGIVRVEWRDVNVFGPKSTLAAQAAYAAGNQDRFWDYHGALYADGEPLPESDINPSRLIEIALELGLDTQRFAADLTSQEVREAVEANSQEGIDLGAFSTPSFLVNREPLIGAQPLEVFVEAIEGAHEAVG